MRTLSKSAFGRSSTFRPHCEAATTAWQPSMNPAEPSRMRLKLRLALRPEWRDQWTRSRQTVLEAEPYACKVTAYAVLSVDEAR
jgi:hypothetical protein